MLDIGASELLLTVIVAIIVIGPKDLPRALRTAGSWIGKVRRVSGHFRSGVEEMIRQAELQEMEEKWREQNKAILEAHPATTEAAGEGEALPGDSPAVPEASAEAALAPPAAVPTPPENSSSDPANPQLPLEQPRSA